MKLWNAQFICAIKACILLGLSFGVTCLSANNVPTTLTLQDFNQRQDKVVQLKQVINMQSPSERIYGLAKAQCWLNFAKHEWARRDASGVVGEALVQADQLLNQLNSNQKVSDDTALVGGAKRIRPDLWSKAQALKQTQYYHCGAAATACVEVLLVQASHNQEQLGWRYANPYAGMAQDMMEYAENEEFKCRPVPVIAKAPEPVAPVEVAQAKPTAPVEPVSPVVPPKPIVIPEVQRITLEASALFKFDKSGLQDVLPAGKQQMDSVVTSLKSSKSLISMKLLGHTDRLGSVKHNDKLSHDRANTIKQYFVLAGIDATKMTVDGVGSINPVVQCDVSKDKKLKKLAALKDCLQPNRRVDIHLIVE